MRSRAQQARDRGRGPRWTVRTAVLCPALAVLLAALVVCLGYAGHGGAEKDAAPPTAPSAGGTVVTGTPAGHPVMSLVRQGDCSPGDPCCSPAVHDVPAVLGAPTQTPPLALTRMPGFPCPERHPAVLAQPPPVHSAPDLHVLQVQRT
ncbi:hypothetical protein [Streptomyces sp. M2CJ-2]|uniref:hypothetical protein n=1 Tax=Streptomyces sp. M2CJ-2 TaxID=2803948 RepID=UPI001F33FD16|nr:hypothetical protein [Streptomyces sp. M2CJ-2]